MKPSRFTVALQLALALVSSTVAAGCARWRSFRPVPWKALLATVWTLWGFASWGAVDVLPTMRSAGSVASAEFRREVLRLRLLCAPLWGDLSPDCAAELERVYMDRDVMLNWHSDREQNPSSYRPFWIPCPLEDRIVWREVFKDPLALREAMEAAAAESRCHAKVGEAPHHLREACAADAFARVSVLIHACGRALYWDGHDLHRGWADEWARERRRVDKKAQDFDDHRLRMAALDESELHFAWRLRKCRAVPPAAMERVVSLRRPPIHFHYHEYSQSWELRVVAARLGSPWANVRVGGTGLPGLDLNATAKESLALAYVRRAWAAAWRESRYWHLAHLLTAREYDAHESTPQLDWSGLEEYFSNAEIRQAQPAVRRLLRHGWQPAEDPTGTDTWPWAIAPPVVATRIVRRRLDPDGTERWVHENGDEAWFDDDGQAVYKSAETDEPSIISHSVLGTRKMPTLRRWDDEEGRPRWLDYYGVEHWVDTRGAEHWVDYGGTKWTVLPPEPAAP